MFKIGDKTFTGYTEFKLTHKWYSRSIAYNLHVHGYQSIHDFEDIDVVREEGKKDRWETTRELIEQSMIWFECYNELVYVRFTGAFGCPVVSIYGKEEAHSSTG